MSDQVEAAPMPHPLLDVEVEAWITVGVVLAWYAVLYVLVGVVFDVLPRLTLDMIEHQREVEQIKETVRNIWTQIALLAALLFTVVAAMLINKDIYEGGQYDGAVVVRTAYVALSGLATLQFVQAICECMVHLVYTEALDSAGVMRYVLSGGAGNLGGPMVSIFLGCFHAVLAMLAFTLHIHGLPAFAFIGIVMIVLMIVLVGAIRNASKFNPNRDQPGSEGWQKFETLDSEQPSCGGHKLGVRARRVLHRRAVAAREYEVSKGLDVAPHEGAQVDDFKA